jgi:hypothetical protein
LSAANPRFVDPRRRGIDRLYVGSGFRLMPGSAAIGAGTPITGDAGLDYFGDPVTTPPTVGFYQPH